MISVILYGRNDSYGYNLHKRAVISFNCIAEVLTHSDDEIIFVDCNTPDDMPTFPEAICDTLTSKAKKITRILRLRPNLYDKYKRGSHLKTLEPLSRNIAIRRSNPSNHWILSTNTDMVFIPRMHGKSLSDIAAKLPDGFYELPRFEVPDALWESLDRSDPKAILDIFARWGKRLHLNNVVMSRPDCLFDGPGDFQLMLRRQIFDIHGCNEEMVLGWHVDSNICRRFYILNGKTESLLDSVFAYHCDHTRQVTLFHSSARTENDGDRFVFKITSPYINEQAETWGIPNEEIEEIHLTDEYHVRFSNILESLLPGIYEAMTIDFATTETYNHGLIYDNLHMFPFLADHLNNLPPQSKIGYYGGNIELLQLMSELLSKLGHKAQILANRELIEVIVSNDLSLPSCCNLQNAHAINEQSDIFIFDPGMMHFPKIVNSDGITFPEDSPKAEAYMRGFYDLFVLCARYERKRLQAGQPLRKFLLISTQHTRVEALTSQYVNTVLTPYSTHVRHGYLRDFEATPSLIPDKMWEDTVKFIEDNIKDGDQLVGPVEFYALFPDATEPYFNFTVSSRKVIQWVIIHKGMLKDFDYHFLRRVQKTLRPVFANEVFVIFSDNKGLAEVDKDSPHFVSLLERIHNLNI